MGKKVALWIVVAEVAGGAVPAALLYIYFFPLAFADIPGLGFRYGFLVVYLMCGLGLVSAISIGVKYISRREWPTGSPHQYQALGSWEVGAGNGTS